jgi:endonuclease I
MKLHTFKLLLAAAITSVTVSATEPSAYYSSCEGKTGQDLLQGLESVISSHTNVGYDNLFDLYLTSDVHEDGTIWDMYSTQNWGKSFNNVKCGNYKYVGDCINKEHSFCKSWFGGKKQPMYSDAFHIYPTDGKVNGQRSNNPYGECANGTYLAANGNARPLGKLGASTFEGYSGTVFEPDDEYKGDFARSYFYMAACYNSQFGSWSSAMLAGNNYPGFTTWATNLLLKWHRQDPVSEKEINRNEAVYAKQHNRNPFIDHPELAEYIWGNKVGQEWNLSVASEPQIVTPVNNSTIDLGLTGVNVAATTTINVSAYNLTADVSVTVSGQGFSASATTLPVDNVNASGAALTISYSSATAGNATGTLTLTSGDVATTVSLKAEAVEGLPVMAATYVTSDAFTANWVNINGAGAQYTLDVRRDNVSIDGYPLTVDAAAGQYTVDGLESETTYTYTVSNGNITSDVITVTTTAPIPSIEFLYDGDLSFRTTPGTPSDVAELLMEIDNIPGDITVTVTAPFQVSLNKQEWSQEIVIAPGADRFYMRLYSEAEGHFTTALQATADNYFTDEVEVDGIVAPEGASFIEDFEQEIPQGNSHGYGQLTYQGSACSWTTEGVYFEYNGSNSYAHDSYQAARFNKSGSRYIYMNEDKQDGMGTLTFWARAWGSDATDCEFNILTSNDGGSTWNQVATATVKAVGQGNAYAEYSVSLFQHGAQRLKIEQVSGGRCMIDDISITDMATSGVQTVNQQLDYHSWDAYPVGNSLVIENNDATNHFKVYSLEGREMFSGKIKVGTRSLQLPAGLYIVAVNNFARRVLVK